MNNNSSPKHTLALTGFILSLVSVFFSMLLFSMTSKLYYAEESAAMFGIISIYTALPGIICSVIARVKKNTEYFSLVGIIAGAVSLVLMYSAFIGSI